MTFLAKNGQKYGQVLSQVMKRCLSNSVELTKYQSELFSKEKQRQYEAIGRIDKIEVKYLGIPKEVTMVMNKSISTPYNCAQHLGEMHCKTSALALIDGEKYWDMHRPLTDSCTLQLLNFHIDDPYRVNKAFWRTCSFLLGAALKNAFRDEAGLNLYSFPAPSMRSGSFVYDFTLEQGGWTPTKQERRAFAAELYKLAAKDLKIERLEVDHDLALQMFEHSPYKREQLPNISRKTDGVITVYRVGDHIDISKGPMVSSSRMIGKCTIASFHEYPYPEREGAHFYRVQGVALPIGMPLNHFAFGVLEKRAMKLNKFALPTDNYERKNGVEKVENVQNVIQQ